MKEIDLDKLFEMLKGRELGFEEELHEFARALRGDFELRGFFEDERVPAENKKKFFSFVKPQALPLFKGFIELLVDQGLEREIVNLAERFTQLTAIRLGVTFVNISSARPLSGEQEEKIKKVVRGNVILRVKIDPDLIGGVRFITSDGRYFDGSLKNKIENLKDELIHVR